LFLGVDVGTSSLKVMIIDASGSCLQEDSERYELISRRDGWLEIDPECWIRAFVKAAGRLLKNIDRRRIRRIGVTGQMHTLVMLGDDGRPVRPAIMWNDMRTNEVIPQIRKLAASCEDGKEIETIISTGSPFANLYWVRKEEPEIFGRICRIQIGWDYLVFRLTGRYCTDYCNASTSALYSFRRKDWSDQLWRLTGLPEGSFPEILGSTDIAGKVRDEFTDLLDLDPETEVITGTGDNPATVFSTGGYRRNQAALSLGTSGVIIRRSSGKPSAYYSKRIAFAFHKGECEEMEQGAIQSCASTYNWWVREAGLQGRIGQLEKTIEIRKEAEKKLLFSPYLAGDKTLYADTGLRGMFVGLDLHTSRKTMTYAVLEGIAFSIRSLLEAMMSGSAKEEPLQVLGGMTENRLFMQILSDVTGRSIRKTGSRASGAVYGIALLAAKADDPVGLDEAARTYQKTEEVFCPDRELREMLDWKYRRYLKMQEAYHIIYQEDDAGGKNDIFTSRRQA